MPRRFMPCAFTLIELLVVITIIVVLLSLLAPAMDKAIYQAQLAVCSSHQHTMINGVLNYAFDHGRKYPYKAAVHSSGSYSAPSGLYSPGGRVSTADPAGSSRATAVGGGFDYRKTIEDYVDYEKICLDPLAGFVDLGYDANDYDAIVVSTYDHYDGYQFYDPFTDPPKARSQGQGMSKVGNRLIWRERRGSREIRHKFNVLVTDQFHHIPGQFDGHAIMGHPSREGDGELSNRQNLGLGTGVAGEGYASWKGTYSHYNYFNLNTKPDNTWDMAFGLQDGSVHRYSGLARPSTNNNRESGYPLTPTPTVNEADTIPPDASAIWIPEI